MISSKTLTKMPENLFLRAERQGNCKEAEYHSLVRGQDPQGRAWGRELAASGWRKRRPWVGLSEEIRAQRR